MKRITNLGNLPEFMKVFLTKPLPGEHEDTEVYECNHEEIINLAKDEQLEPQVLIDRKKTGKAFIAAVGAKDRSLFGVPHLPSPVFYFAELSEAQRKEYTVSLQAARDQVVEQARIQKQMSQAAKLARGIGDE